MFKRNLFYIKDLLNIAGPIMMGNLAFVMICVGDIVVAGRHSTSTLAAISLATAITSCIMMLGIGILVSISAVISNYRGEGKNPANYFYASIKYAMFISLLVSALIFAVIPAIDHIGFEPSILPIIKSYMFVTAFSTFGAYLHCAMKEFLQAMQIVIVPNIVSIISVFINVFLNVVFVFGWGFIPEMGAIGLAIASLIARYIMGIALLVYALMKIKVQHYTDFKYYKDLTKVGLPISMAILIEFIGFNIISVVMGRVSSIYAAANNIICTLANVTFMVPLAVSNAVAVKVGYTNGAKYFKSLKRYAYTGILMSISFMALMGIIFAFLPNILIGCFTTDTVLIKVCVPIVYVLACFEVLDGLQVSLSGVFKGIKQTKVVMISNLIGYWIVAFPLGCLLAFKLKLNLLGFWYAMLLADVVLCSIMVISLFNKFRKMEI